MGLVLRGKGLKEGKGSVKASGAAAQQGILGQGLPSVDQGGIYQNLRWHVPR